MVFVGRFFTFINLTQLFMNIFIHTVRSLRVFVVVMVATVLAIGLSFWPLQTQASQVDDSYISTVNYSVSGTTHTVVFTTSSNIESGQELYVTLSSATGCNAYDWSTCEPDLSNSSVSGIVGNWDGYKIELTSNLAAGSHTLTLSDVEAPSSGSAVRALLATSASNEEELLGTSYDSDTWYATMSDNAANFGSVVVSGTVSLPSGDPAQNISVQMYNSDWSVTGYTSTDEFGYYALFSDYQSAGYWTSNTYTITAYPEEGSGYINTSSEISYSGSAVSNTFALSLSEYFFSGTVTYGDTSSTTVNAAAGDLVDNAIVYFYDETGSGSFSGETDSSGSYTAAVAPGTYTVSIEANVDRNDASAVAAVNWQYSSTNTNYTISDKGTETVNFEVDETAALTSGTVSLPNGSTDIAGSLNFTNEDDYYWAWIDDDDNGSYIVNMDPGKYTVNFYPETSTDSSWEKYSYSGKATIIEGSNTLDITLDELSATVDVSVTDEAGAALTGINVSLWNDDHWVSDTTDSNGSVTVYIYEDKQYFAGVWDDTYIYSGEEKTVKLGANESTTLSYQMSLPDATISGTLVTSDGKVPESVYGYAWCATKDYAQQYGSDISNGSFEIGVMVDGENETYNCNVWLADDSLGASSSEEVTITDGETVKVIFTLAARDATLRIPVKNFATGKKITPDDNVNVNVWNKDNVWYDTQLDENPATINVVGGKKWFGGLWSESSNYIPLWNLNNKGVKVSSGETKTMILNVLEKNGTLPIEVLDPNGKLVNHAWAWCGNWEEVDLALDGVESNVIIDSGTEVRNGEAEVGLVSGHTYNCGIGLPPEYVDEGWMSPPDQQVEFNSKKQSLDKITFQFEQSDATLRGSISVKADTAGVTAIDDLDHIWCWAWSEDGSHSFADVEPGEDYSLNVDSDRTWHAGCDAQTDEQWYWTEEYEFKAKKGDNNTHAFKLKESLWVLYESVAETFDATTNKVITLPDGTTLTIPANALASSGNVTVTANPQYQIVHTQDELASVPWDFEATNEAGELIESFNSQVTISIPYQPSVLKQKGISEDALIGKYYDEDSGTWKKPDNVSLDSAQNKVIVQANHFTQYGVTYNANTSKVSKPVKPRMLRAITVKSISTKLHWKRGKQSASVSKYKLQVRQTGSKKAKTWRKYNNVKTDKKLVKKLEDNTPYQFRVKACNNQGCSKFSKWQGFRTK